MVELGVGACSPCAPPGTAACCPPLAEAGAGLVPTVSPPPGYSGAPLGAVSPPPGYSGECRAPVAEHEDFEEPEHYYEPCCKGAPLPSEGTPALEPQNSSHYAVLFQVSVMGVGARSTHKYVFLVRPPGSQLNLLRAATRLELSAGHRTRNGPNAMYFCTPTEYI